MNINKLNPYIRRATKSVLTHPFSMNERVILDYEIIYVESGNMRIVYNSNEFICPPGSFVLIHPDVPHTIKSTDSNISQPHIHFDLEYDINSKNIFISFKSRDQLTDQEKLMMRRDAFLNRMNSPLIFVNDLNKLANVFYDVIYSYGLDTASSKILSKAKLIELLSIIVSDNAKFSDITASAGCDVLEDIKNYIDANLNSDISLDGIEKQFHYSKFYMEKKFNERFGMPIIKYCKIMKLEYSKSILSEKTVNETADFLSFGSVYSFIRSFKRAFGVSPGQYKKSLKLAEISKADKHE